MIDKNRDRKRHSKSHFRQAVKIFGLIALVGLLLVVFAPRRYHSDAKLFVRLGRESVGMDPTAAALKQQAVSFSAERENEIRSIVEMLRNRQLCEDVVEHLGPEVVLEWQAYEPSTVRNAAASETNPPQEERVIHWTRKPARFFARSFHRLTNGVAGGVGFRENDVFNEAVDQLKSKLHVDSKRESNVITVAYRSSDPRLSQDIVSSFVDAFLESHPKWNRAQNSTEFFQQQVQLADVELNSAHTAFAEKKNELHVASLATYADDLAKQLTELEVELMAAQRLRDAERTKLEALQSENDTAELRVVTDIRSGMPDAGRDSMRGQLYELELEERALAARYHDGYAPLTAVRQQIAAAQQVLDDARDERSNTTRGLNPIRTEIEKALALQVPEVAAAEANLQVLQSQYDQLTARVNSFNLHEIELASLQRKVDLADSNFRAYAASWEEARVDHALQNSLISNVNVVQHATLQPDAVFPRELPSLLGFAIFGLIAAGLKFWYDERKIASIDSRANFANAMRAPVLAQFPTGREPADFDLTAERN